MSKSDASIHVLRKVVVDTFLLAGLATCIFITDFLWMPFKRGFFCGDETLMFPFKEDTVTSFMLRLVGLGLPIMCIIICEWVYLRKEQDDQHCFGIRVPAWLRGAYCTLVSFGLGVCFIELTANVAKNTIGRPRPHFFDLCKPSVDCSSPEWQHRYIQAHEYHCTSQHPGLTKNMRMSFLSGHSAWAAYTMVYLALYLENRMVWRGSRVLRHTLSFGAVMLSWFTALSRVSDYKHHWSDVLAGYGIGLAFAVLVWFWGTDLIQKKKNHTPLPQNDVALTIHPETLH
ncbi:putative phosphatidate phosphatase [Plodia interpunctella]|uniref:putative phosphatidate phosphatase n=1 Tax=Plodia interpunctella TaxID=58824 RepID=UPI0023678C91|nr:putative phosphatidate phosphatase [Plodia interpunctella]